MSQNQGFELVYSINGLKEWLSQNIYRLRDGVAHPFSLLDQEFNILYSELESFVIYSSYILSSEEAIIELKHSNTYDDSELIDWCWKYEELGNALFGFAIHYLWWDGLEYSDNIKMYEDIYCEIAPFNDMILISKIFQIIIVDGEEKLEFNEVSLNKVREVLNRS